MISSKHARLLCLGFLPVLLLVATPALAETAAIFRLGYSSGGDPLALGGLGNGKRELKANEGFFLGGGISVVDSTRPVEVEVSLFVKKNRIGASSSAEWTRYPVETLVFYRLPAVRFGGGLTYSLDPTLDLNGVGRNFTVTYKSGLGLVLQTDWRLAKTINLGLRYGHLEYKEESTGAKFDSSGFSIVLGDSF